MKKPAVILATALSTVALAGAVGIGVASADPTTGATPGASSTPTAGAPATPNQKQADQGRKAKRDLFQRALHGEVVLGGKKHRVVDFQRGEVTAVSSTSITVKSKDGFTATYVVNGDTKVRQAKEKAAIADVKTGDKVRVVGTKDGSTITADRIVDRTK